MVKKVGKGRVGEGGRKGSYREKKNSKGMGGVDIKTEEYSGQGMDDRETRRER